MYNHLYYLHTKYRCYQFEFEFSFLSFSINRSRSHSKGSLFAVGGKQSPIGQKTSTSLDTPNSHPGSRRCSRPSIVLEPDPEIYGAY